MCEEHCINARPYENGVVTIFAMRGMNVDVNLTSS